MFLLPSNPEPTVTLGVAWAWEKFSAAIKPTPVAAAAFKKVRRDVVVIVFERVKL